MAWLLLRRLWLLLLLLRLWLLLLRSDIWVAHSVFALESHPRRLVVGRGIAQVRRRGSHRIHVRARLRGALHRHLWHPLRRLLIRGCRGGTIGTVGTDVTIGTIGTNGTVGTVETRNWYRT